MPSKTWAFIVDKPELRIQQNPKDSTEFNFDVAADGVLIEYYWTVKVKAGNVRYKSWDHLAKVVEGLEDFGVSNLPVEIQSVAKEIIFEYEIPF